MRAFWWFKDGEIAGMARPGFNQVHWFDLPFHEAAVLGWVGNHSSGTYTRESFHEHIRFHIPRIFKFHDLDEAASRRCIEVLMTEEGLTDALDSVMRRTRTLETFFVGADEITLSFCPKNLEGEITHFKSKGITRLVALTEKHHSRDVMVEHFDSHHLAIDDLGAPRLEQVHELAKLIEDSRMRGEAMAVHCMAGIGRTSTMLMAAHLVLGEKFEDLEARLKRTNPRFALSGSQGEFLRSLKS